MAGEYHKIFKHTFGEVSEWFKELVLKTSDSERDRGFESHLLRFMNPDSCQHNLIET